ncbi:hypothetical protein G1K75_09600 [Tenacibaculum finnmarkense]|uniref:carboxypeptidase-like regulatory domain-containing protein n=1 Tax=Tenacibaculum finnmarkense TaxID=2781243 RepID=UPI001E2DDB18|nr:carboxypeptidase-like regulatory domain-containing protein [Tenacibaculum finnmarkense]MCD8425556.1 carboxypeptidase-like regulatory domain-containing protein [Tenacibaculum dicentrarchi]MCG8805909.1 hypothetical protein [Tenacibaculum finnmarkense]MCG8838583.1 hypothetical protein [Tenacibaculum dicentrarchi]
MNKIITSAVSMPTSVDIFDRTKPGCKSKKSCGCGCQGEKGTGGHRPLTFSGKVIGGFDNDILVGATVVNKNSKVGVMTDFDGNFKVIGNSDDLVHISFVGYKDITLPFAKLPKVIKLESDGMLDEIIITAKKPNVKAGLIVAVAALAFYGYAKYNETGTTTKKTTKTVKKKVTA